MDVCPEIYLSFWAEIHYNSIYPVGGKFTPTSITLFHFFSTTKITVAA
jgi:hypothetical protein